EGQPHPAAVRQVLREAAVLFGLTAALLEVLTVSGFWAALFGGLVVSIVAWLLEFVFGIAQGEAEG
ncbi:MAG: hypothetical protein ABEN55_18220, partial [Bradymonadaceae bacterium]